MENEEVKEEETEVHPNIEVKDNGTSLVAEVNPIDPMGDEEEPEDTSKDSKETETSNESKDDDDTEDEQSVFDKQAKRDEEIKADLAKHDIDFDALGDEYQKNGELSKESLEKLEKAGYPKAIVDAYLDGLQASTEKFVNRIYNMAGGKDNYEKVITFLKTQPESVVNAYNATIAQGNLSQIELTLNGIKSQMKATYGTANPTLMGGASNNNVEGYTSMEQMTKDMSDPRYQVDPKFTKSVMMKIKNATIF